MELSKEWSPGPVLRGGLLWDDMNLYVQLHEPPPLWDVVAFFVTQGWSVRHYEAGWPEVRHEWAHLQLGHLTTGECLLCGVIDVQRLDELVAILALLGRRYSLELWDEDQENLLETLEG